MLLKTLHLINFTSYKDATITFTNNSITTISAPNGYGKSSILDGITTALFYRARGTDAKGSGMDNIINNEAKAFEVELNFEINGNNYIIHRKKTRNGKQELTLLMNGTDISEKVNETQAKINNIIKMNYETFLDTVCIGQGMSSNFMSKKPQERKEVFIDILNLNDYNVLEKYAKDKKKELKSQLDQQNARLSVLSDMMTNETDYVDKLNIANDNIKDLENKKKEYYDIWQEELNRKNEYIAQKNQQDKLLALVNGLKTEIQSINKKLNDNANNLKTYTDNIKNLTVQETQLQNKIDSFIMPNKDDITNRHNTAETNKQKAKQELQELNELLIEYNTKINVCKNKIEEYKQQYISLKEYDKGVCSFCGNEITKEHKQEHLDRLKDQASQLAVEYKKYPIDKVKEDIKIKNNEIKEIDNILKGISEEVTAINKALSDLKLAKSNLSNTQQNIQTYVDLKQNIENDNKTLNEELKQKQKQLDDNKDIQELPVKTFNDVALQEQYDDITNQYNQTQSDIKLYTDKLNDISNYKAEYTKIQNEVSDFNITISDYDSLIEAFGKKGIQADIISNVLPEIEIEINKVLSILFASGLNIEFILQKEGKTTTLETLDIIIHDEGCDRYYETYSGGEKFRIDLAFHIGLSKFLSKRANANIEFFMIDEGLGSQDDEGRSNFITVINKLRALFSQIFIITHIDEVKDAFDSKITIVKDPVNGSKIA